MPRGEGRGAGISLRVANLTRPPLPALQRGDAEMEQKLNRAIRACVELGGAGNPIMSIHDQVRPWERGERWAQEEYFRDTPSPPPVLQGAGGNCNVLKEIVSPAGGRIDIRALPVGDPSMSVLELWCDAPPPPLPHPLSRRAHPRCCCCPPLQGRRVPGGRRAARDA